MDTAVSVELFVEILNRYVYYFDQGNDTVNMKPYVISAMLFQFVDPQYSEVRASSRMLPRCFDPSLGCTEKLRHLLTYPLIGHDKIYQWLDRAYSFKFAK